VVLARYPKINFIRRQDEKSSSVEDAVSRSFNPKQMCYDASVRIYGQMQLLAIKHSFLRLMKTQWVNRLVVCSSEPQSIIVNLSELFVQSTELRLVWLAKIKVPQYACTN
jgi:hypothetical protein